MPVYGYARISTRDQTIAGQEAQLIGAGCVRVFSDTISGAKSERPGLSLMLDSLQPGDLVIVSRLDRLGRSVSDLISIVQQIEKRKANFRSLAEAIDTETATGRMIFHIFAAIAEFERQLIRERTFRGLAAAHAKGSKSGRPAMLNARQIARGEALSAEGKLTHPEIARALGVSPSTWRRTRQRRRKESQ